MPKSLTTQISRNRRRNTAESQKNRERFSPVNFDVLASFTVGPEALSQESFEIVGYTGGPLDLPNFEHVLYIDCSTASVMGGSGAQSPLLFDHDSKRPLGHGYFEIQRDKIRMRDACFTFENPTVNEVQAAASKGQEYQASIGAKLTETPAFVPQGKQRNVNGRVARGPCFIARNVLVREQTVCVLGRDLGRATARIAAAAVEGDEMGFEAWAAENGFDLEAMSETAVANLRSMYETQNADDSDTEDSPDTEDAPAETVEASASTGRGAATATIAEITREARTAAIEENRRINSINAINASYSSVEATTRDPLYERAIEGTITSEAFELGLMRAQRDTPQRTGVATISASHGVRNPLAVEAALLYSNGMSRDKIEAAMSDEHAPSEIETAIDQASSASMRRMRWSDAIFACYDANGLTPPSRRYDEDVLRGAWEISASASSTVSLPSILEGTVNRHLLDSYNDHAGLVDEICGVIDAPDFKDNEALRLTASGQLERVAPDDDITSMSLSEESTKVRCHNHSKLLTLSEEAQLSDDLGAFLQMARLFARAGANSVTIAIIEALTAASTVDGKGTADTFFRSQTLKNFQPNYLPTVSPLDVSWLDAACELLENQTDNSGLPVQVTGNILLTTPKNKALSKRLYASSNIAVTGTTDKEIVTANPHEGLFMPVSSSHLGNAKFNPSGASNVATQRYLIAKQGDDIAPIMVAYLANRGRAPRVRSFEEARRIGVTLRPQLAFGVAMHDKRTIVKGQ